MSRVIAIDDAGDLITVHLDDGTKEEYESWDQFVKSVDLDSVETYNDMFGDWWHSNGVAPLTAYPVQGPTVRPSGQGCSTCRFFSGCLATMELRGDRQYQRRDGGVGGVSPRNGIACTSYEAGLGA